jgi:hypothetical protein
VADSGNSRIQKFSSSGKYLGQWASPGPGAGVSDFPLGIAADPKGDVYVAGTNSIQKYDSSGVMLTRWGEFGKGPGQFRNPQGIAADSSGNVYVGDSGNDRVQKFHDSGPPYPDPGTARLRLPRPGTIRARAGGTVRLPVRVRNTGSNAIKRARLCVPQTGRAPRSIYPVPCVNLGSIGVGKQKTARLRIRIRCRTAGSVGVDLKATASNARPATTTASIRITACHPPPDPFPWEGRG